MKMPPVAYGGTLVIGMALVVIGASQNNSTFLAMGVVFMIGSAVAAFASRTKSDDNDHRDSG